MTAKRPPAPRSEALEAGQTRPGDAGNADASATPEYTTSPTLGTAQIYLVRWLLAGALLDLHAAPALACPKCLLPYIWCCCQAREVLRG